MKLADGQRWRYRDSMYCFVVQIVDAVNKKAMIVQNDGPSGYNIYAVGKMYNGGSFVSNEYAPAGWYTYEYLEGQDAPTC